MKFGLKQATVQKINSVFAKYSQLEEAILYGSRAKGNYKNGSDIDIALKGNGITLSVINTISLELDDLLLPYSFDISVLTQINNEDLIEHIDRVGIVFYKR